MRNNVDRLIVLDTETTGFEPSAGHRLVEIGALELINLIPTGRRFHYYVNPERDVPYDAYRVHGISTEFLKDKPLFHHIADEFLEFIASSKLVIHNAKFDMKFINHELKLSSKQTLDMSLTIDTLLIARKRFPGAKASLDDLCRRYKVDTSKRNYHGALLDAELLAEVYIELMGGSSSRQTKMEFSDIKTDDILKKQIFKYNANKVISPTLKEMAEHENLIAKIKNPIWQNC